MYRPVYYLVHYDCKNYRDFFVRRISGLISKSGSMVDTFSRKNTHKAIGDSPVRTGVLGVRSEWGVPLKKISLCREVVLWDLQIDFLIYLTHFLEFWGARGLYITARDLPRAVRPKLVVIGDSRVLFESIFVQGILRVITQRCVRARSPEMIWSTQTVFIDLRLLGTTDNSLREHLRRK